MLPTAFWTLGLPSTIAEPVTLPVSMTFRLSVELRPPNVWRSFSTLLAAWTVRTDAG